MTLHHGTRIICSDTVTCGWYIESAFLGQESDARATQTAQTRGMWFPRTIGDEVEASVVGLVKIMVNE
jgi:hypothetical protein